MLGKHFVRKGFRATNFSGRPTNNYGANVAAGTPAHTLSASFTEIVAATDFPVYSVSITICATAVTATQTDALTSLYIGDAGSEKLWIPTLLAGWASNTSTMLRIYKFPLYLPQGTRISGKSQGIVASDEVRVAIDLSGEENRGGWYGNHVECLGVSSANSRGTDVTPGTTSDGTWTDIGTSGKRYGYILPMIQGTGSAAAFSAELFHLDIGTGSALFADLEDFLFQTTTAEVSSPASPMLGRFTFTQASTAFQVRLQNSSTSVNPIDCALYGVF